MTASPSIEPSTISAPPGRAVVTPRVVLHSEAPLNMLSPFLSVLEELGFECQRRDYEMTGLQTVDELHLVWGMRYRPPIYEELAKQPNVYFLENGWFTQQSSFYIDKTGPNGLSSIRGACRASDPPSSEQTAQVTAFIERLHHSVKLKPVAEGGYIFIPLQVERDSQLLFWSNCAAVHPNRQVWFVDQVCSAFPKERIVIRPHPRDPGVVQRLKKNCQGLIKHRRVEFRSDRKSYDWLASAKAVAGINSTVLLEALTFYKPVCAMGSGVFTNNRVVLECNGDPRKVAGLASFIPDRDRITSFLSLLIKRQVPYAIRAHEIPEHAVLSKLLNPW